MRISFVLSLLLLHCTAGSSISIADYNWEDLQVLNSEKNYVEYLDHALDIEPSKRDAAWKTVTEKIGLDYLKELVSSKKEATDTWDRIERISTWPIFKNNEFFIKARDEFIIHSIKQCKNNTNTNCSKKALKLLNDFQHEITFPAKFLTVANELIIDQTQRFAIASPLIGNKLSEFYCSDSPIKVIVLNQIIVADSKELNIHPDCIKVLKTDIEKLALEGNETAKYLLNKNSLASPMFTKLSVLIPFLNDHTLSKKEVNTALKSLETISKLPEERKEISMQLKKLDPIPGRIFNRRDKTTIGKLKVIERNFPEFIDLYARTCLQYLKGEKKFRFGNPTPECHNFFALAAHLQTFPESMKNEYGKATHFMRK